MAIPEGLSELSIASLIQRTSNAVKPPKTNKPIIETANNNGLLYQKIKLTKDIINKEVSPIIKNREALRKESLKIKAKIHINAKKPAVTPKIAKSSEASNI